MLLIKLLVVIINILFEDAQTWCQIQKQEYKDIIKYCTLKSQWYGSDMVFGFLSGYDPDDDVRFIVKKFIQIRNYFHPIYKKKKFITEGDFEKFFKSKDIIKKKIKINKKIKLSMNNCDNFMFSYNSNDKFKFQVIPILGFAFNCYSIDIEGFSAGISFESKGKIIHVTRDYNAAGALGPKQSSSQATKLMNHLISSSNNVFKNAYEDI